MPAGNRRRLEDLWRPERSYSLPDPLLGRFAIRGVHTLGWENYHLVQGYHPAVCVDLSSRAEDGRLDRLVAFSDGKLDQTAGGRILQEFKSLDKSRFYSLIEKYLYAQLIDRLIQVECEKIEAVRQFLSLHHLADHIDFKQLFEGLNRILLFKKIVRRFHGNQTGCLR